MNREEIAAKVKSVVAEELGIDPDRVTPHARFAEDLGANAFDEIALMLEEEFEVELPDEDTEKLVTVGDAIELIERKLKEKI